MCREVEKIAREERNQGRAEGILEAKIDSVRSIVKNLKVSADEAMDILNLSDSEREAVRKAIEQ